MRRPLAHVAEVVGRGDDARAKVILPKRLTSTRGVSGLSSATIQLANARRRFLSGESAGNS